MNIEAYAVEKNSQQPLWAQLTTCLAGELTRRQIKVGEFVWSIRRLAILNNVSVTAMAQAYKTLVEKGVLKNVPQKGYVVGPHARSEARNIFKQQLNELKIMSKQMHLKKPF